MAQIKINPDVVLGASVGVVLAQKATNSATSRIASTRWGIDGRILGRHNISNRLGNVQSMVAQIAADIQLLNVTVNRGANLYNATENRIISMGVAMCNMAPNRMGSAGSGVAQTDHNIGKNGEQFEQNSNSASQRFDWKLTGNLWKVVENAGVVGKFASIFGTAATEGVDYKSLLGGAKKFVTVVGDLAKNAYSDTPNVKETLLGKWGKGSAFKGWDVAKQLVAGEKGIGIGWATAKESFFKQVSEFRFKKATTVGDKVKVGAKWAGVVFSATTNGISNYQEYKDGKISAKRAVAETITETAVDVAVGTLVTTAVTAGAAALGFASAPAVVVGAVAVGVTWLADAGCRFLTKKYGGEEKSLTETLSDFILDAGGAVADAAKGAIDKGGKFIGNAVNSMGKAVAKWLPAFG